MKTPLLRTEDGMSVLEVIISTVVAALITLASTQLYVNYFGFAKGLKSRTAADLAANTGLNFLQNNIASAGGDMVRPWGAIGSWDDCNGPGTPAACPNPIPSLSPAINPVPGSDVVYVIQSAVFWTMVEGLVTGHPAANTFTVTYTPESGTVGCPVQYWYNSNPQWNALMISNPTIPANNLYHFVRINSIALTDFIPCQFVVTEPATQLPPLMSSPSGGLYNDADFTHCGDGTTICYATPVMLSVYYVDNNKTPPALTQIMDFNHTTVLDPTQAMDIQDGVFDLQFAEGFDTQGTGHIRDNSLAGLSLNLDDWLYNGTTDGTPPFDDLWGAQATSDPASPFRSAIPSQLRKFRLGLLYGQATLQPAAGAGIAPKQLLNHTYGTLPTGYVYKAVSTEGTFRNKGF